MSVIVENAIAAWKRKAEHKEELKNNKFRGKKLNFDEYFRTPEEHRMGMKILKDANCIPPAVDMMKQIEEKKKSLTAINDQQEQAAVRKEIRDLELKKQVFLRKL